MLVSDFDFTLPESLIAQHPPALRGGARMLALDRLTHTWQDRRFLDLPELLRAGDVLVLNNSRVIPARLFGRRQADPKATRDPGGSIEVLLTEQQCPFQWKALVRPARKVPVGTRLLFSRPSEDAAPFSPPLMTAEVIDRGEFGERTLRFEWTERFFEVLDQIGHMPLPPYIHRADEQQDWERYQTVYADTRGSVAAPTAGLHFTSEMLRRLEGDGVEICYVTLHVGLGTFQPVRVERLDQIRLHTEHFTLPAHTASRINTAKAEGRRVIAAGTTTVRVLEHCATVSAGGHLTPLAGATEIFLSPGHRFRIVDALLTNFHLPQSTLLMLVSAFVGRELTLAAYRHAVEAGYQFFSYGDCMFIS